MPDYRMVSYTLTMSNKLFRIVFITCLIGLAACSQGTLPLDVIPPEVEPVASGRIAIKTPGRWSQKHKPGGMLRGICASATVCYDRRDNEAIFVILEQDFTDPAMNELLDGNETLDEYVLLNTESFGLMPGSSIEQPARSTNSQGLEVQRVVVTAPDFFTLHRLIYFDEESKLGFTASFAFTEDDGSSFQEQIDTVFNSFVVVTE